MRIKAIPVCLQGYYRHPHFQYINYLAEIMSGASLVISAFSVFTYIFFSKERSEKDVQQ